MASGSGGGIHGFCKMRQTGAEDGGGIFGGAGAKMGDSIAANRRDAEQDLRGRARLKY